MGTVSDLLRGTPIPRMINVRQEFERPRIEVEKIPQIVREQLMQESIRIKIRPGMRIAITAGSRGVSNIAMIIKAIVDTVKELGASPFIVPAMGSHGGATAQGQRTIIEGFGITEEAMGCPILASMETEKIGYTEEGHEVQIDKNANRADGILVVNRVKPHTAFRGPYESGLMKMMAIGLGKQAGAQVTHKAGFAHMAHMIPLFGKAIIKNAKILAGVAILENPFDETCKIEAMPAEEIEEREPGLQAESKALMPKILIPECDVLIVDEIGKNIAGSGMDPNITGTFGSPYASGGLKSQRVCILDLSDESHHNGNGMGTADVTTRRLVDKVDLDVTYPNGITSTLLESHKIPMILPNDKEAIQMCVRTLNGVAPEDARIIRIKNSLHIEHIQISEPLLEEAKRTKGLHIESEPYDFPFDENGNLF